MFWALTRLNACNNGCDLMEFIRINDNMIKCLVSDEDLEQYDVSIEDFFTRTENALDFIHEIMKMAEEEVDYKPDGPLTSLQIAPTPDKGLAIFLTEKSQVDLKSMLQNLQKGLGVEISDSIIKKVENSTPGEQADFLKKLTENLHNEIKKNAPVKKDAVREVQPSPRLSSLEHKIFSFDCLSDVYGYAKAVEMPGTIGSALYKDEQKGLYYLMIERKDVSVQTLAGVYLTAYEYGHFVSEKDEYAEYIREHYECIIEEDAIGKLKK